MLLCSDEIQPKTDCVAWPCGVCHKGVGRNSILYNSCNHSIHKHCSGIHGRLVSDPTFKCTVCAGMLLLVEAMMEVTLCDKKLKVVDTFCYLVDVTGQAGFDATTARARSVWKKFHDLLPILTSKSIAI